MTKQEFVDQKIKELKKTMYKDEIDLMSEDEEIAFRKFFEEFINDLKKVAKTNGKQR
jgi:hypothetical protein